MREPLLFIPKKKLLAPSHEDNTVFIELMAESNPIFFPFDAMRTVMTRYPLIPEWQEWQDGTGGSLHVTDKSGEKLRTAVTDPVSDDLITPYNSDGVTIHDNELVLFALGVKQQNDELGVLWGVLSKPFEAFLQNPDDTQMYSFSLDHETFGAFYRSAYPQ